MNELRTRVIFDLKANHSIASDYLAGFAFPWEALDGLKDYIVELGKKLPKEEYDEISEHVWVAKDAKIAPTAFIGAPCIIGKNAEVRHCAFIRGSALVGEGCVVGNSVELKNAVLFDGAQVPHFNYVGDSIIGYKSHMGAGAVTSNLKSDKTYVTVAFGTTKIGTGRKKVGAFLGDNVEVGCNSVLCPGTVISKGTTIYPLSRVRGYLPENCIYKDAEHIVKKEERQ